MKKPLFYLLFLVLSSFGLLGFHLHEHAVPVAFLSPSAIHPFGTNAQGQDLLNLCCTGVLYSLFISLLASFINTLIGSVIGILSALLPSTIDRLIMNVCNFLICIPRLMTILILSLFLPQDIFSLFFLLSLTGWISTARVIRAHVHKIKQLPFVISSKGLGANRLWIALHHCWPNCRSLVLSSFFLSIPRILTTEAFLSFLGKGLPPPAITLGYLCTNGIQVFNNFPWVLYFPTINFIYNPLCTS